MPLPYRCARCDTIVKGACPCYNKVRDSKRLPSSQRGYDHKWRKARAAFLSKNPLCHDCSISGHVTPAVDVHHIVKIADDPSLRLDFTNLMALCKVCHSIRTARGE